MRQAPARLGIGCASPAVQPSSGVIDCGHTHVPWSVSTGTKGALTGCRECGLWLVPGQRPHSRFFPETTPSMARRGSRTQRACGRRQCARRILECLGRVSIAVCIWRYSLPGRRRWICRTDRLRLRGWLHRRPSHVARLLMRKGRGRGGHGLRSFARSTLCCRDDHSLCLLRHIAPRGLQRGISERQAWFRSAASDFHARIVQARKRVEVRLRSRRRKSGIRVDTIARHTVVAGDGSTVGDLRIEVLEFRQTRFEPHIPDEARLDDGARSVYRGLSGFHEGIVAVQRIGPFASAPQRSNHQGCVESMQLGSRQFIKVPACRPARPRRLSGKTQNRGRWNNDTNDKGTGHRASSIARE